MNFKIKELEWRDVVGGEGRAWYAETPSSVTGGTYIFYEEDKYWPSCTSDAGHWTLDDAKCAVQEYHNDYIKKFITPLFVFD